MPSGGPSRHAPRHMATPPRKRRRWPVVVAVCAAVLAVAVVVIGGRLSMKQSSGESGAQGGSSAVVQAAGGSAASGSAGQGSAAPERGVGQFRAMVDAGQVGSIRLIGDSITAGYLCDGWVDPDTSQSTPVMFDNGYDQLHYEPSADIDCWANDFRSWAGERGIASFTNAGLGGWTMRSLADDTASWVGDGADVIFVALGCNDAAYFGNDELRQAAEVALPAVADSCKLMVVVGPTDNERYDVSIKGTVREANEVLREVCDEHGYIYVDCYDAVTTDDLNADLLHPTSAGSHKIWNRISGELGLDA